MLLDPCDFDLRAYPRRGHGPSFKIVIRSALCSVIAFVAVSGVCVNSQQTSSGKVDEKTPSFEVAAIRVHKGDDGNHSVNSTTDRISIGNYTLRHLIRIAYDLKSDAQITGGPDWIDKQAFDISAKIDDSEVAKIQGMKREDRQKERSVLLQSLLADRFQLRVHTLQQVMPVYALVVGKSGAKLAHSDPSKQNHSLSSNNGHMEATSISMDAFADDLTRMPESGDRVVLNRTGLNGDFDFKMDWTPDYGSPVPADAAYPGLLTALQEQLGLKLESQKGSVDVVVVESAVKPTLD